MRHAAAKLLVYDRTCAKHYIGLSTAWSTGGALYRGLGRIDHARGVASWKEAFDWLRTHESIGELQYWGHGRWGRVMVDADPFDRSALEPTHPLHDGLLALRERLTPDALVWFRTCEAFGASPGIEFAERLAETLGVKVAGHTHVIGVLQSGLRALLPGKRAAWSPVEGLARGTANEPEVALGSGVLRPRTISCLNGEFPAAWFAEDSQ